MGAQPYCVGKHAFDSRTLAEQVAQRSRRKDFAIQVYRCEFCGAWHLGNRNRKDRR